ncbi:hypothetical protein JHK87_055361 [Glycine soja]|nr:hypothetical protein JHK87_055361 [Glycine soja]
MGLRAGTAHLQKNLHRNVFVRGTLVNAIMEAEYEGILEFRSHEKSAKQGTGLGHQREEKPNVAVVGLWFMQSEKRTQKEIKEWCVMAVAVVTDKALEKEKGLLEDGQRAERSTWDLVPDGEPLSRKVHRGRLEAEGEKINVTLAEDASRVVCMNFTYLGLA